MKKYYTYDTMTKALVEQPPYLDISGKRYYGPSAAQWAIVGAYTLGESIAPTPPEGKIAVVDGFVLQDEQWVANYVFKDAPPPALADYDAIMEEYLTSVRSERGYTTREPDSYLTSAVPRWKQDAKDWVAFRDAVMEYALEIINAVAGGAPQPTLSEFKAGLPVIEWTFA